jgi:hypothetical protein
MPHPSQEREMEAILNLTQDQIDAGVVEPNYKSKQRIIQLLSFEEVPTRKELIERAKALSEIVYGLGYRKAMIGGASYLMGLLSFHLQARGITPLHSFTKRNTIEVNQPDGTVKKVVTFKHITLIEDPLRIS